MDFAQGQVASIAHSIQLSVAPVFLLSGIGVFLSVLTARLARVIDRARPIEEKFEAAAGADRDSLRRRLRVLSKRARLINASITLATVSALLVAIVVALLFA